MTYDPLPGSLTLAKTTVPSGTERSVTSEQSNPRRKWKKAGSVAGGRTDWRYATSVGRKYRGSDGCAVRESGY